MPSPLAKAAMGVMLGLALSACGGAESEDSAGSTTNMEAAGEAYAAPEFDTFGDTSLPPDQTTGDGSSSGMSETGSSSGTSGSDSTGGSSTADGTGSGSSSGSGSESGSSTGGGSSSG